MNVMNVGGKIEVTYNLGILTLSNDIVLDGIQPACGDNSGSIGFFLIDGIDDDFVDCFFDFGNFNFGCNVDIVDID